MEGSEGQLALALAADLSGQFEQLVRTYQDRLYGFALSRLHDTHVAEEITILALERAYYALKGYPAQRIRTLKLSAWLLEITRNACYNYIREHNTRNMYLPADSIDVAPDTHPILTIEDNSNQPENIVCQQEGHAEILACIAQLPQQYRTIIHLYYIDNLTGPEIAAQLKLPPGTVKSHIHRGTRQLQALLNSSSKEVIS